MKKNVQFEVGADRSMQHRRALLKAVIIAGMIEFPLMMMAVLFMPYDITDSVTGQTKIEYVYVSNRKDCHGKLNSAQLALELFACSIPVVIAVVGTTIKYR